MFIGVTELFYHLVKINTCRTVIYLYICINKFKQTTETKQNDI